MGKRSRSKGQTTPGEVGPRQPCPCGSGRRYKACHGDPSAVPAFVARPFEGMPSECDVIALRELVPAATAPLPLVAEYADRTVRLCSLLPAAAPAMVRDSGEVWLGLQVQHNYGDPARDLGAVLVKALAAEVGPVGLTEAPAADAPRIQDLVAADHLQVSVLDSFGYWIDDLTDPPAAVVAAIEQADASITPTVRLTGVTAAYWADVSTREHLRWVRPEPEDALLDALARLHAAGDDILVPGARFAGMFRAHGLLAPVWDLPSGTGHEALEGPAQEFDAKLVEALAAAVPLTTEERSARAGLAGRQVTIR
ncbi:DUF5926 family protein [Nocardioides limicola]|uniref:DUF5926 family protein n=1 Tax=Nocardioides limicola TaxID=2803368 RepID=UPI00193C6F53|nr:DUF5926 family protein [Nocardioides sp. DJM-14]